MISHRVRRISTLVDWSNGGPAYSSMEKEQREWEEKKALEDALKSGNIASIKPTIVRAGKFTRDGDVV